LAEPGTVSFSGTWPSKICRATEDLAPKIHNLVRLTELANLSISKNQRAFLGQFNQYQLVGRYPERLEVIISIDKAKKALQEAEQMLKWLNNQF
jgi:hypothetical protein